jgi:hypothetical protein
VKAVSKSIRKTSEMQLTWNRTPTRLTSRTWKVTLRTACLSTKMEIPT